MSSGLFQNFIKYEGEKCNSKDKGWYKCKNCDKDIPLTLSEENYILKTKFTPTKKGAICFRIEDFKEYFFNDRRKGPKDNDLTILSNDKLYQIEIKENGDTKKVNSQFTSGDPWVKFIMWFNNHISMCDYKKLKVKHIFIRIKGKERRSSLERGKKGTVSAKVIAAPKRKNCNYVKVILKLDSKNHNFKYINFDINQVINKA